MQQLDYRPNSVARALVTGRSKTLGVVSFDTTLYGPASTLFGIERAAHDAGYFISIVSLEVARPRRRSLGAVERLRAQGVDGILVIAPQESATRRCCSCPPTCRVVAVEAGPDGRRAGASRSTSTPARGSPPQHLLELGHRTVCAHRRPADWLEAQQRVDGLARRAGRRRRRGARAAARRLEPARRATSSASGCSPSPT